MNKTIWSSNKNIYTVEQHTIYYDAIYTIDIIYYMKIHIPNIHNIIHKYTDIHTHTFISLTCQYSIYIRTYVCIHVHNILYACLSEAFHTRIM